MIERETFGDKALRCVDCGESFIWTSGEQLYSWSKGLAETRRCKPCRQRRKLTIMPSREVQSAT